MGLLGGNERKLMLHRNRYAIQLTCTDRATKVTLHAHTHGPLDQTSQCKVVDEIPVERGNLTQTFVATLGITMEDDHSSENPVTPSSLLQPQLQTVSKPDDLEHMRRATHVAPGLHVFPYTVRATPSRAP